MKKQYICPTLECVAVHYRFSLCSGSETSDTINSSSQGGSQGGSRAPRRPKF